MSLRLRALCRSNDTVAEAAGADELARGSSAIDSVLAGYFAAAGAYPSVLLGPVTLLIGGVGSGDRAFDGRVRQPGRNAKRPRGILPGVEPPTAARVGIPASVPALAVSLGYGAQSTLRRLVQAGVVQARERGAERRAAVLSRVGEVGALALAGPELSMALVRAFGPPSGGLVTPADFVAPVGLDAAASKLDRDGRVMLAAPWASEAAQGAARGVGVCAVDVKGLFAVIAFEALGEGLYVDELELSAPLLAAPTLRGVPRVAPGTALPMAAPIWIEHDNAGAAVELWCAPMAKLPGDNDAQRLGIRRNNANRTVEALDA